jgi:hypothetical protein
METVDVHEWRAGELQLARSLRAGDPLTSALLAGLACPVERLFTLL